ncbi:hypothetical protein SS50377_21269 [Spironucleus salmonicida]|uniref:Transmembrane protein n=1 Tax=Spironucleus salmonicida TaxID=348837 RepID=V6LTC2_9EUKA|nr:hypothetical protein SS50377_21269 [Spironucleus salmonicida]|eukprot:EST44039.1 hypothetical protein SS50377_16349 [Spironucleus salmonicida]
MIFIFTQVFIKDDKALFKIDAGFNFSKLAITSLIDQSLGLVDQGFFNFNRTKLTGYDCVNVTYTKGKAPKDVLPATGFVSYKSSSLSGLKGELFQNPTSMACTNTLLINLPKWNSNQQQKSIGIAVFLIIAIIIIVLGTMTAMVSINDEAIEEVDDTLLYNCPEMAVCPEAFLNDEPWEAGADDF